MWLFDEFLDAMGGHMPICLITYQDPAMKVTKQAKFHSTSHKNFVFGISWENFLRKLGALTIVMMIFLLDSNHVCTIQRFQSNLNKGGKLLYMILGCKIMHGCLNCINIQDIWIPVYFGDLFCEPFWEPHQDLKVRINFSVISWIDFWVWLSFGCDMKVH